MDDPVAFLRARIDEDEAEFAPTPIDLIDWAGTGDLNEEWISWARKRLFAEVAAKRAILDGLPVWEGRSLDVDGEPVGMIRTLTGRAYRMAMLVLAQPYAEHPDFDPDWRLDHG